MPTVPNYSKNFKINGTTFFWWTKRLIDIISSLILSPLVLFCAILLWFLNIFLNPGPLLYSQTRFGKDMKTFQIFKFRTMVGDSDDSKFAPDEAHRITKLGVFLRHTHIDELPQFFNVLIGNMSILGPRPEQRKFVEEYLASIPNYKYRHIIRPGISGLAQVEYGYASNSNAAKVKLKYDLYYIKTASFSTEVYIILKTLKNVSKKIFTLNKAFFHKN